jgi:hypothetical protein
MFHERLERGGMALSSPKQPGSKSPGFRLLNTMFRNSRGHRRNFRHPTLSFPSALTAITATITARFGKNVLLEFARAIVKKLTSQANSSRPVGIRAGRSMRPYNCQMFA